MAKNYVKEPVSTVFALLIEGKRALDIVEEAQAAEESNDPIVRGIIDEKAGYILLGAARPYDEIQERIIRIETNDRKHTKRVLRMLPDIDCTLDALPHVMQFRINYNQFGKKSGLKQPGSPCVVGQNSERPPAYQVKIKREWRLE